MPVNSTTRRRRATGPTKAELEKKVNELEAKVAEGAAKGSTEPKGQSAEAPDWGSAPEWSTIEAAVLTEAKKPVEAERDPATKLPQGIPKYLLDRMDAAMKIVGDVQAEIETFKSHPDYREGDLPVTLYGIQGPGNRLGTRTLNYVDEKWLDPSKAYRWSNKKMIDYHRGDGWYPCDYDNFMTMIKARGGAVTFGKTAENHVQIGDLVMMETSRDWHDQRVARIRKKTADRERRAKNTLYQKGKELGVEVYEGDAGPKLSKIIKLLNEEFGEENVKRIFLSH